MILIPGEVYMGTEVEIRALRSLKNLYKHRNEMVVCNYIKDNKLYIIRGRIKDIDYFNSIKIDNYVLRFIGNSSIIKSIVLDDSKEVLFINNYLDDYINKEDIPYIVKEIFGGLINYKNDLRYKIIRESVLYINPYYLEEWVRLVNYLLDNNKKFILSMLLEYFKRLDKGSNLDSILDTLDKVNLDNKYKVFIKKCLRKYYINNDIKLGLKKEV